MQEKEDVEEVEVVSEVDELVEEDQYGATIVIKWVIYQGIVLSPGSLGVQIAG